MIGMDSAEGEDCPFAFNFDEKTFKVGDSVSYRVTNLSAHCSKCMRIMSSSAVTKMTPPAG